MRLRCDAVVRPASRDAYHPVSQRDNLPIGVVGRPCATASAFLTPVTASAPLISSDVLADLAAPSAHLSRGQVTVEAPHGAAILAGMAQMTSYSVPHHIRRVAGPGQIRAPVAPSEVLAEACANRPRAAAAGWQRKKYWA